VRLQNLDVDEIGAFYDSLTSEKEHLDNPLEGTLEFVTGIRVDNQLVAIGGLRRRFRVFHFVFRVVVNDFQGRGLSKQLKRDIDTYARDRGYSFYMSSVKKENTRALDIFPKQGARIVYKGSTQYVLGYPLNRKGECILALMPMICRVFFAGRALRGAVTQKSVQRGCAS
jgi:GNAT superfamily N-acetyltransferase